MANDSGERLQDRFGQAFIKEMANESEAKSTALHLKPEEEIRIRKSAQDPDTVRNNDVFDNLFSGIGRASGKFAYDEISSTEAAKFASEAVSLVGDDLYTGYCKWAEKPEDLGTLAAKLNKDANWSLAHGDVKGAISEYRRELRLIKSCGGVGSSLATSVENTIKALEFPSAYSLSADMITEIDLLARKGK